MICIFCGAVVTSDRLVEHCSSEHADEPKAQDGSLHPLQKRATVFRNNLASYALKFQPYECRTLQKLFQILATCLSKISTVHAYPLSYSIFVQARFIRDVGADEVEVNENGFFSSPCYAVTSDQEVKSVLKVIEASMDANIDEWTQLGSG